jgi:hypothetical protein
LLEQHPAMGERWTLAQWHSGLELPHRGGLTGLEKSSRAPGDRDTGRVSAAAWRKEERRELRSVVGPPGGSQSSCETRN